MADQNIPESILRHVRKCANREDVSTLRTVVSNEAFGIGLHFTLFAIVEGRGIVRPSDVRGQHRPAGVSFLIRLDFWPEAGGRRAMDDVFQRFGAGSLGRDILPLWRALFVTTEGELWPSILPRENGKFISLAQVKPSVEIALNGDFFEVIIHGSNGFGSNNPLVWLAFRKQFFLDECVAQFRAMERKFAEIASCEAEQEAKGNIVDGNKNDREEDEPSLEDFLFWECFDD